jgi:glutamine synthetase
MPIKTIKDKIKDLGIKTVELHFTDLVGEVRSLSANAADIDSILEVGMGFDGSSVPGYSRIECSDMRLIPDRSTFAVLPWEEGGLGPVGRMICDVFHPDGKPDESDPRFRLKEAVKSARDLGYKYYASPELEFFLFPLGGDGEPVMASKHNRAYFSSESGVEKTIRQTIADYLDRMGYPPEMGHNEVAEHQHEIDLRYGEALKMADAAATFKLVAKKVAADFGYDACFLPKPVAAINGSGMHVHQSLFKGSANAFYGTKDGLSDLAKRFVAGQLHHLPEIVAVLAPTANSYERLVPGFEAPTYICWGYKNRSALIRVPQANRPENARIEIRCPDISANPYLVFTVLLAAGLAGIKGKMAVPEPVTTDIFLTDKTQLKKLDIAQLPGSLSESAKRLASSEFAGSCLGERLQSSLSGSGRLGNYE